jgi:hypothetical protein
MILTVGKLRKNINTFSWASYMELASISGMEREKGRQYLIYDRVSVNVQKCWYIDPTTNHLVQIRLTRKWKCSVEESFDTRQHVT